MPQSIQHDRPRNGRRTTSNERGAHEELPESALRILGDPAARKILERLDRPTTALELVEACDLPETTVYRKLDRLVDASLVEKGVSISADGHHAAEYVRGFDLLRVRLDEGQFVVRSEGTP